jgi:tripartite-type tricarboxylate transporter receptor subunit TctC
MKLMKSIAAAGLICASLLPSMSQAQAQAYPSRTINFIVPYTPGTTADVLARLLGAKLSQRWNVAVVVENKTGASGIIGTDFVAKAAPDGYTILFPATSFGTLAAINPKLPYDSVKSFAPVSLLGTSAMTLVVSNKFPANNVRELIDQAKKQPGIINYASPGTGGSQHLAMELFKQEANINMLHVPYKGTAGAINDLIAGHVQASVVSLQSATPFVQKGGLRMLGVMSGERVPTFPQVPTLAESGFPSMQVETWYGVMAPAGTPPAVIAKLNAEINQLLTLPDIKEAMAKQGVDPAGGKPDRLDTLVRNELKLWTQVVTRGKIVAD